MEAILYFYILIQRSPSKLKIQYDHYPGIYKCIRVLCSYCEYIPYPSWGNSSFPAIYWLCFQARNKKGKKNSSICLHPHFKYVVIWKRTCCCRRPEAFSTKSLVNHKNWAFLDFFWSLCFLEFKLEFIIFNPGQTFKCVLKNPGLVAKFWNWFRKVFNYK